MKKSFASDNWSGVSPEIIKTLNDANFGHNQSYGEFNDPFSESAFKQFKKYFGNDIAVYFVYNGTAANVLSVSQLMKSYNSLITAKAAHINEDECAAPEKFIGVKILEIETDDGKIKPKQIKPYLQSFGFQHHSQPKVISISQVTEHGTLYQLDEIKELANFAHSNNMFLHMDGARISNAAVSLGLSFKEFTKNAGVDVLSFGGTKNGMMFGEAIVFLKKNLAVDFKYLRKQGMQLHSKMRYIAAQFECYLKNEVWEKNAIQANGMAQYLANELRKISGIKLTQQVSANGVFVIFPPAIISRLQNKYFFHVWNQQLSEVRLMCSWDTNSEDVDNFIALIKKEMSQ